MLTSRENYLNIFCVCILAKLCVIPIWLKPNVRKAQFHHCWRLTLLKLMVATVQLHVLFSLSNLIEKLYTNGVAAFATLSLNFVIVAAGQAGIWTAISNFHLWPEVTVKLLCQVLCPEENENLILSQRSGPLRGYSYLDVYTMIYPIMLGCGAFVVLTAHVTVNTLPVISDWNVLAQCLTVILEVFVILIWMTWLYFCTLLQILFIEKMSSGLQANLRRSDFDLRGDIALKVRRVYKFIRILQHVNSFNDSQKISIFLFKIVSIGNTIQCGSAAVQFFHGTPTLTLFNASTAVVSVLVFIFLYDKGFSVPRRVAKLQKLQIYQLRMSASLGERDKKIMTRQWKSVGRIGIMVGNFHYLQRMSTPNYLDFCVKNLVRLVITFRRYSLNSS